LGEAEVSPERLEAKLVEIAEHYQQALAQATAAPSDDPDVAKLKGKVKAALGAGELERADDLLAQVQAAEDAALERRQLEAAATAAQRGEIALTRLRRFSCLQRHLSIQLLPHPNLASTETLGRNGSFGGRSASDHRSRSQAQSDLHR
jgi:hypothetical protein